MDRDTKHEIICESFDLLKDLWEDKRDAITRLICKMFEINPSIACDMWLYILKKNHESLCDISNSYNATILIDNIIGDIIHGINCGLYFDTYNNDKEIKLAFAIFENKELTSLIYGENCSVSRNCQRILSHLIASNDTTKLFDVLEMIKMNDTEETIGNILTNAIEHCKGKVEIPKINIELLEDFVSKLEDKLERAEAFTALLSIEE